jgi:hypothetical protein
MIVPTANYPTSRDYRQLWTLPIGCLKTANKFSGLYQSAQFTAQVAYHMHWNGLSELRLLFKR